MKELEIDLLDHWPPYSPDLNNIEVIWAIMGKRVEMMKPKSIEDLEKIVIEVWNNITFKTNNGLVDGITDIVMEKMYDLQKKPVRKAVIFKKLTIPFIYFFLNFN